MGVDLADRRVVAAQVSSMLIDILRDGASALPDQVLIASHSRRATYQDCRLRADAIAAGLRQRSVERFACLMDDPAELLALLCGSSGAGSEACVYPGWQDADDLSELAAALGHTVFVTDRRLTVDRLDVIPINDLAVDESLPPAPPEHSPVLILTTGTTGRPKGARHDWSRLVRSVRHPDAEPGGRWLLTYNLNQFAGLQMLLHVLVSRAMLVVPASRRPSDVLTAMRTMGVTHASGTPTFWRLLTGGLDDRDAADLALEQITLGGEAVPEALIHELRRLFPNARISQVYASTESGSNVSVRDDASGLPLSVLDRDSDAEVQFRIVDGELEIRTRLGMLGYYGERDRDDGWYSTGDLVEVHEDRIRFVGRAGETINVGGAKIHPLPIEDAVSSVDGVMIARAYGRKNPVTGEIVVVDVVARAGVETASLERKIRAACAALPSAARPRRIRFVPSLDVRGDKIARGTNAKRG